MKILLLFPFYSLIWCQIEVDPENTLDIMTWNLKEFPLNGTETVNYVGSLISSSNLDVIALQEIENPNSFNDLVNSLPGWNGFRANSASYDINLAYLYTDDIQFNDIDEIYTNAWMPFPRSPLIMEITFSNQPFFIINNHFKARGDGIIDEGNDGDEEYRRQQASIYLKNYIDTYLQDENVIVLGDLNDELTDSEENNVFWNFISDPDGYLFVDMEIAEGSPEYWSYPMYGTSGSHIDHILVTNELFDNIGAINTVLYDTELTNGWSEYESNISDHRPVYISLCMDVDECGVCNGTGIPIGNCDCFGGMLDDCDVCDGENANDLGCGCFIPAALSYCEDTDGDGLGAGEPADFCLASVPGGYVENCSDPEPDCQTNDTDACSGCGGGNANDLGCGCFIPAALSYCEDTDGDGLGAGEPADFCLASVPGGYVEDCSDPEPDCQTNDTDACSECGGDIINIDECNMGMRDYSTISNPENFILNTYPNPFNPRINITVYLSESSQLYIHILNITGQVISTLESDYVIPGTYHYVWHANNLPSGIYIVRVELNNNLSKITKIIKLN